MVLRIEQEAELVKTTQSREGTSPLGWWHWRVWVEGGEEELARIEWVRYQLHPTFPNPTRIVADRHTKFELRSAGWGEFTIYAAVHLSDGSEQNFKHWLRLGRREASTAHTLGGGTPKLFLAYAFADTHVAQAVGEALRASQVEVLDPSAKIEFGEKWPNVISSSLDAADVAAVFISEGAGPWLLNEVRRIRENGIDLLPIIIESTNTPALPEDLSQYGALYVKSGENPADIANRILQQMPALRVSGAY
jgi:YEATS family/TIR domain